LRALIVDDEAPARRRLARQLAALPEVEVAGEADDAESTLRLVAQLRVDVLFLDIHLPGLSGLQLVQRHTDLPAVVFVTAFDSHAVEAFEVNAVDYLLKPVRADRLRATIDRLVRARGSRPAAVARALGQALGPAPQTARLVSHSRGEVRVFDTGPITRLWASDKYTVFRWQGGEELIDESLSQLEERLRPLGFVRSHRSELIRLESVRALRRTGLGHEVVLADGQVARVSRRALTAVKSALHID
jgi:DNA-binding LytR/AlgR family response regulator